MSEYVSSIINKYGDMENVVRDSAALHDIFKRQGASLFIDVIAEEIGMTCNKFNFTASDRAMTKIATIDELENAINERI